MPTAKPSLFHKSGILKRAWSLARYAAKHHGGRPSEFFRECLKQAWARAKEIAASVAAMRARVLACVAELRAQQTPLAIARRQKRAAEFAAECQAALAKATARTRALAQPAGRRVAA